MYNYNINRINLLHLFSLDKSVNDLGMFVVKLSKIVRLFNHISTSFNLMPLLESHYCSFIGSDVPINFVESILR
jgi:hypothetical protein